MKIKEWSKNSQFQGDWLPDLGVVRKFSFSRGVALLDGGGSKFLGEGWYPSAYYGKGSSNPVIGGWLTQVEWEAYFHV